MTLSGRLAPGPDYKLYFSPEFVETEADFNRLKPRMVRVGDVKTFDNFVVSVPPEVDPARYSAVIVWCERFGQFIKHVLVEFHLLALQRQLNVLAGLVGHHANGAFHPVANGCERNHAHAGQAVLGFA